MNTITSVNLTTIAVTNLLGKDVSLPFGSDAGGPFPVGNPSSTSLHDNGFIQYAFPTGWAGRICVDPDFNPDGSKIEGNHTGPLDIDVSYVNDCSVPITCSSEIHQYLAATLIFSSSPISHVTTRSKVLSA